MAEVKDSAGGHCRKHRSPLSHLSERTQGSASCVGGGPAIPSRRWPVTEGRTPHHERKRGFSKEPLTMGLASTPSQSSRMVAYRPRKSRLGARSPCVRSSAFREGYSPY